MNTRAFALLTVCFVAHAQLAAQGSAADYERANSLRERAQQAMVSGEARASWLEDGHRFWFVHRQQGGKVFEFVDAKKGERRPAFDHQRLAKALAAIADEEISALALPFDRIEFTEDERAIRFPAMGSMWTCKLDSYQLIRGEKVETRRRGRGGRGQRRGRGRRSPRSPDGKWQTLVRDHNLFVKSTSDEREFRLSHDGKEGLAYGSATWSPDSETIVAYRITPGDVDDVHLIETSPADQLEAKLRSRPYARPGDRFPVYEMHVFSVASKEGRRIDVEPIDFRGPPRLRWQQNNKRFTYEKRDRGHQRERIMQVDVVSAEVRTLIDEQAETFIDDYHKHMIRFVDDGKEIIWASERDGWNHLYLYDGEKAVLKNQITKGPWLVRGIEQVDDEKRQIWFSASGMYPDEDPYLVYHYRIDFDGRNLLRLNSEKGNHQLQWSPNGEHFVDTWSMVDLPPTSVLRRRSDGEVLMTLAESDPSAWLETGLSYPEVFTAKGRDGETDIWGIIVRPTNFDPARSYPVVEYIYAGPHNSHVPKSFRSFHSMQVVAELGFILVQIDGMGTNNRSKAFHDVCWQNLADAGFPDRKLWIKAAAKTYPYMDLERVGIYGTSAGGQNSLGALLFHPEFYKVAVSSCGCHDNRLDKASWNEQWMGYPVGPHYEEQSNVTHAKNLEGKLLLILGELDTNVPPESTY
ncbi:MAG: DPP IV N-terminal domain-containing protein, partial [Planctomycetota bacterium]